MYKCYELRLNKYLSLTDQQRMRRDVCHCNNIKRLKCMRRKKFIPVLKFRVNWNFLLSRQLVLRIAIHIPNPWKFLQFIKDIDITVSLHRKVISSILFIHCERPNRLLYSSLSSSVETRKLESNIENIGYTKKSGKIVKSKRLQLLGRIRTIKINNFTRKKNER